MRCAKPLTPTMRTAIRWEHEGSEHRSSVKAPTIAALVRRGYMSIDGETMERSLTPAGERAYERIMRSGDGPEDLKALFKPLYQEVY